jgi:hypothetical protein
LPGSFTPLDIDTTILHGFHRVRDLDELSSARELLKVCTSGINITPGRIARCLFPEVIKAADGSKLATRPKSYDPPMGWTPPIA